MRLASRRHAPGRVSANASPSISGQRGLHNLNFLTSDQRIRRIYDNLIVRLQADDNFYFRAEIVAGSDVGDGDLAVFDDANLQLLRAKKKSAYWKQERGVPRGNFQMDFRIGSREEGIRGIGNINLHKQSTSGSVNGF